MWKLIKYKIPNVKINKIKNSKCENNILVKSRFQRYILDQKGCYYHLNIEEMLFLILKCKFVK